MKTETDMFGIARTSLFPRNTYERARGVERLIYENRTN